MSSKINLQTCEYARKSSIFQDNQLIYYKLPAEVKGKSLLFAYHVWEGGIALKKHYPFENAPLAYAYDALEPYIDEKTMQLHHERHLKTYNR